LVFHVTDDGRLRAFSPDKGQKLFEVETGHAGTGPPITYELNGKQYIAFVGGTGLVSRSTAVPTNEKIPNPPLLFVFTLDGHGELPKPATP
jgi:quinohemoprotein ethanol dehydrogenase